ncbi:MAG: DUF952 domain-containing protein [Micrococcales bacterium]|nr:DUF952 domain-containing protein [Micrococcales bacterium]
MGRRGSCPPFPRPAPPATLPTGLAPRHRGPVGQTGPVHPDPLFHVADAVEWADALTAGRYERSTRGLSLAEVGFVHLSTAAQWPGVLERFYADHDGDLLLLTIDPTRLGDSELRWETGHPGSDELFPHLYGPLDVEAVTEVRALPR